ncbi:nuclear transport factor 2 family protein [Dactylosporangium sp. AC04546]|uniref:nuclear transport factor 2 family protein n=1 Tax=Dactylosporangium sp. AC04546 TaxID=2862460 RepID=UPI001EDDC349|nr:nuclear transport factor 2 family protein [Dactylosporangium sp. AC04546]WVK88266.1 nuclear transport factor 2 family protein [Dactylosporangium sp. AC04546]
MDSEAVRRLALEYARGCDRRDAAGVAALFTPDGRLAREPDLDVRGRAAIAERIAALSRYRVTTHFVGNHLVDGDRGEVYCMAYHLYDDRVFVMSIRYQDRYAETDEGWRFAERVLIVDWTEDRPLGQAPA